MLDKYRVLAAEELERRLPGCRQEESVDTINEWINDILKEWKNERQWEIDTYGAPYGMARAT